jgi:hypothetical protein
MKRLFALSCLLLVSLSIFAASLRSKTLVGTWKSNKEATLAYLQAHSHLPQDKLDTIGKLLGKMTITFTTTNVTMKMDDWNFSSPYDVVSETRDFVVIQCNSPSTGKPTQDTFNLDGDSIWIRDPRLPGYKERFDRVVEK